MVTDTETVLTNPQFDPGFQSDAGSNAAWRVHRKLPGYAPSPLIDLPAIASALGVNCVWLKDESSRMGLPAFKILGASWAVIGAIESLLRISTDEWSDIDDLRRQCERLLPLTLACATDGNHGRAVARMARWLGFGAIVLVPDDMSPARIDAIKSEGAEVRVIAGTYDDAIDVSATLASERCLVISDTAWPGYETIPQRVIEGYSTILQEAEGQLQEQGGESIDLVSVPIGVGALAAAVVSHFRSPDRSRIVQIVGVEPIAAACMMESARAGQPVQVPGPHTSIMSGLNCGLPSPLAWPIVSRGTNLFATVSDDRVRMAMRNLASVGVRAGECGAAGLAGVDLLREQQLLPRGTSNILLISTEGATDLAAYEKIVGRIATC
jgi:diaminopropionate ammonia-lyase